MRILLAVCILVGPVSPAMATCFGRARVVQPVAVVAKTVVAVPVAVPVYSQSYHDLEAVRELRREIAELRSLLASQKLEAPAQVPASEIEVKAVTILKNSCASCHTAPNHKGGLAMFDAAGSLAGDLPRGKVYYQAHRGLMPKGGKPLVDAEVEVLLEWLGSK